MKSSVDLIKRTREDLGMTWAQFANSCGISYGILVRWLTGIYFPDDAVVRRVSQKMGLDATSLLKQVVRDKQELFSWAKDFAQKIGIRSIGKITQLDGSRNYVFLVNDELVLKIVCEELMMLDELHTERVVYQFLLPLNILSQR